MSGFDSTYQSVGLREFESRYANKLSYRELESLVSEQTGNHVYTCTQLQRKVKAEAVELSTHLQSSYQGVQLCLPFVNNQLDLYDIDTEEVLFFDDGIGVKRQKDKRKDDTYEKPTKRIISDIFAIQKPNENKKKDEENEKIDYHYITDLIDSQGNTTMSGSEILHGEISKLYKGEVLNFVAITDGARNIRLRLWNMFGKDVPIILDWYHLKKKVNELMSMMGLLKSVKETHIKFILSFLWEGDLHQALLYIEKEINPPKSRIKHQEHLLKYLEKHENEIINYKKRQSAGKVIVPIAIGTGMAENAVFQVIGRRQKNQASAWTTSGSKGLAVLKVLQLNGQWSKYWNNKKAA